MISYLACKIAVKYVKTVYSTSLNYVVTCDHHMLLTVCLHEKHIRLSCSSVYFVTLEALMKVTVE